MKKLLSPFFTILMLLAAVFTGCGHEEPTVETNQELQETLNVSTCSPEEGAEVVATEVTAITLTFPTPVQLDQSKKITLNDQVLTAEKQTSTVTMAVSLEHETAYTLQIPAGAIRSMRNNLICNPAFTLHFSTKAAPKEKVDTLPNNEAMALTRRMGFGWNLGNHFDTSSGQDNKPNQWGYWDNKANPTQQLYQNLAKYGVKTVRVCVTWGNYQDPNNNYTISPSYMEEVAMNVGWARDAGLNVILNTHHDEYWLKVGDASQNNTANEAIKARITTTWTQIANRFVGEGDYLIMETFNEIHEGDNWSSPTAAHNRVLREWTQTAIDAIRATGGNNASRYIAISGYSAAPGLTMALYPDRASLPTDAADNKLVIAIHCYDPYDFTLSESLKEQWGHTAKSNKSSGTEQQIVNLLQTVKSTYIDQNIPCYMGEFGCSVHTTSTGEAFRKYYLEYFCRACHFAGLAPCLWDNYTKKSGGAECHDYIDHNNGSYMNTASTLIPMMIKAVTSEEKSYTLQSVYNNAPKP